MRFIFKLLAVTVLIFSLSCKAKGQEVLRNTSILNYQRGDHTFMHFGFTLGVNYMDYRMIFSGKNPLRAEAGKLEVGFLVGIISELRVTDDLGLRFLPGLEFATRRTIFTHVPEVEENKMENFNESVYITLPFMMKYKAKRINNFRPYMAAGPSLKYDFHGHRTIDPERGVYLRTKPVDVFLETALGCDFYLPYFKFGMELRFAWGLTDVLVKKHDLKNPGYEMYTDALKKMKARMFTVCFNFE